MSFSYLPLWRMLSDLGISKMDFAKQISISNTTLAKMGKDEPITLSTIDKICNEYGCKLEDVVVHIPDVQYNSSANLPEKGTIILVRENPITPGYTKYSVVLNIAKSEKESIPPQFYIAPIASTNLEQSFFNIKFKNVIINHEEMDGYIALGKSRWVNASYISGNFGIIPEDLIRKLVSIVNAAIE